MKEILPNLYLIPLGGVNAYLIDHGSLTLIDTGYAGNGQKILDGILTLGKSPEDLENIIITHLHTDHAGSLAEIKAATSAKVYMHAEDAPLVEKGQSFREQLEVSPGLMNKLIFRLAVKNAPKFITPAKVDHYLSDGDLIPAGKGLSVIHVPGHARGQIALLYGGQGGILFAADTTGNVMRLGIAPFYEDYQQGIRDIQRLSGLSFKVAVFGHGKPILQTASDKFKQRFRKLLELTTTRHRAELTS